MKPEQVNGANGSLRAEYAALVQAANAHHRAKRHAEERRVARVADDLRARAG